MITTKEEFWKILEDNKHEFYLSGKNIRSHYGECPVSFVANKKLGFNKYMTGVSLPSEAVGLDVSFASNVADASDGYLYDGSIATLRNRIMDVLGL